MPTRITPNLWFDTEAQEAAEHYVSIFPNWRVVKMGKLDIAALRAAADGVPAS